MDFLILQYGHVFHTELFRKDKMNEPNLLLLVALAGSLNKQYLEVIDFLNSEISILKDIYVNKLIPLNNNQRRLLAAKFKKLDKEIACQQELLVTPKTMMIWYKKLIAQKWNYSDKTLNRPGRPKLSQYEIDLTLDLLNNNPSWGDDSISNRLKNLGVIVSKSSVTNIRKKYGIPPAPQREKTGRWDMFLKSNWGSLVAIDFKTVEIMNPTNFELETFYVLFAMHLSTREVKLCGLTTHPKEEWMVQMARNLTDPYDGFFLGKTHCIMDNDTIFSAAFKETLKAGGTKSVLTAIKIPNMNAFIERYNLSFKNEALKWIIPQSQEHLRQLIKEWLKYYNTERNHQGISEKIINPGNEVGQAKGTIKIRSRLGGALRYYYRKAA